MKKTKLHKTREELRGLKTDKLIKKLIEMTNKDESGRRLMSPILESMNVELLTVDMEQALQMKFQSKIPYLILYGATLTTSEEGNARILINKGFYDDNRALVYDITVLLLNHIYYNNRTLLPLVNSTDVGRFNEIFIGFHLSDDVLDSTEDYSRVEKTNILEISRLISKQLVLPIQWVATAINIRLQ